MEDLGGPALILKGGVEVFSLQDIFAGFRCFISDHCWPVILTLNFASQVHGDYTKEDVGGEALERPAEGDEAVVGQEAAAAEQDSL